MAVNYFTSLKTQSALPAWRQLSTCGEEIKWAIMQPPRWSGLTEEKILVLLLTNDLTVPE